MQKRILLALSISFLVIGFYPVLLQKLYPEYGKQTVAAPVQKSEQARDGALTGPVLGKMYDKEKDVLFKNDKVRLVFNTDGGAIREIAFLNYLDHKNEEPLKLVSLNDSKGAPLSLWIDGDESAETAHNRMGMGKDTVEFQSVAMSGAVRVSKKLVFHPQGYSADLYLNFENISQAPVSLQYELFAGARIKPRHGIDGQYIEANFFSTREKITGKIHHVADTKKDRKTESGGFVDWVAAKDRHFSFILKPEDKNQFSAVSRGLGNHELAASLVSPKQTIQAGGQMAHRFVVYAGPNDLQYLQLVGLDKLVNFGKLDIIGKVLIGGLETVQKVCGNYGVAIILLTILTNILLFPLTRQSYMSMKRMQLVQPQMAKLREQHGKNPEKLNKEMMELYKKHKVNPFGGCLPMLMQMPIFMALYVALSKAVTLIDAGFLWVDDLSSPDRVNVMGHDVHVLPLIMVAAMVIQQKFTQIKIEGQSEAMEQQQKMMAVMMPLLFGFIFYAMPSGLVLYWLTNTILMSGYQLYLKNVKVV